MIDIVVRYLHYLAIFVLIGAVVIENMAVKPSITGEDVRNLAKVDAVAGISAVLVFLFGLSLWLWLGKPAAYYSNNPVFHAKLGLFILVIIMAIYPARFFFLQRNSSADVVSVPKAVVLTVRIELLLLFIILILAMLMARGVGLGAGSVTYAQEQKEYNISVSAADDLISDFESIIDIVFIYQESVINQLPFQQFDWISRRDEEIARLAEAVDVVSISVSSDSSAQHVPLPTRVQDTVAVFVFASHEDPVAEAIDISDEINVELRVESWGINVISQ